MSLFSFFRKNKQETPADSAAYSGSKQEPNSSAPRARRKSSGEDDSALLEKKRARRRLIGAIALVLAAVIGLPMVLDSEPVQMAQDIEIKIPSKNSTRQSHNAATHTAIAPIEPVIEPIDEVVTEKSIEKSTEKQTEKPTEKPTEKSLPIEPVRPQENGSTVKPVTSTPVVKPESVQPAETKQLTSEEKDAARARAILEGKPLPKFDAVQPAKKSGKYMLQVAALSSSDKVTELRNKLKTAGITSHTQKVPTASGESTRVRVGPFESKEEAEKMRQRLLELSLNGTLVSLSD